MITNLKNTLLFHKKNPHCRILRRELKEQYLNIGSKCCLSLNSQYIHNFIYIYIYIYIKSGDMI